MNYIGKVITNFRDFYNEINSATLTGAIDVVVVKQPDGAYICSPFHVRFGKLGVLRSREKVVDIEINGEAVDIHMKLGESGEAFFVEEVEEELKVPSHLATSPIPLAPDIGEELRKLREQNEAEDDSLSNTVNKSEILIDRTNIQINNNNNLQSESVETQHISTVIINGGKDAILCNGQVSSSPEDIPTKDIMAVKNIVTDDRTVSLPAEESSVPLNKIYDNYSHSMSADQDDSSSRKKRKRINKKKRARSRELTSSVPTRSDLISRDSTPLNSVYSSSLKQESQVRFSSDEPEDIFQMDDFKDNNEDDEGFLSSGLSRSISLPVHGNEKLHDDNEWLSRKLSITYIGEFHPFSDGDVTPLSSPIGSRPPSPKSDTEYEINKTDSKSQLDVDEVNWSWGELPSGLPEKKLSVCKAVEPLSSDDEDLTNKSEANVKEKRSMLGGMLNLMRSTKKLRHMPESEGIYLDQLNPDELDPEIAALYFPKFRSNYPENYTNRPLHDEDTESGNGSSLPHSPHSVEGAIGEGQSVESDNEERQSIFDYCSKFFNDIAMSACGGLQDYEGELPTDHFLNSLISYDEFTENPSVLQNPNLVIRISGKYYNWQTAAPMLLSLVTYQKPLSETATKQLISEHMPKKKKTKAYSWWNWRRNTVTSESESDTKKIEAELLVEKPQLSENHVEAVIDKSEPVNIPVTEAMAVTEPEPVTETLSASEPVTVIENVHTPAPLLKMHTVDSIKYDIDGYSPSDTDPETSTASSEKVSSCEKYMKSLRLSSKQLESLKLKDGPNEVVFSVTTAYQGTTRCTCSIFLWSYDDKIVISDIDGTITKSDVLGHILPIIGKDWAQLGVAKLFSKIRNNGYQFLYLSARAIGQAQVTREYLRSVKQGDLCLPDGPLLLSPTSLLNAFHREVIKKKPEEFKISCLKDIQALFPGCTNPFCSGFGNKINDIWAYRAVSIPLSRIFTINHRGELKLENIQNFQSSYNCLSDIVDHIFPPLQRRCISDGQLATNFTSPEEFSFFTFWRDPLPILSEDDQLFKSNEK